MRIGLVILIGLVGCETETTVGSNYLGGVDATGLPACIDDQDNDGDGATDYPFDPGCSEAGDTDETDPAIPPVCSNGDDDDGDGIADFPLEPGCESAADGDETDPPVPPECSNGVDDDGDGATDYPDDDSCDSAGDPVENTVTS